MNRDRQSPPAPWQFRGGDPGDWLCQKEFGMLKKKMRRELLKNFGQYFSLFILVLLAVMVYAGFAADPIGGGKARDAFHKESNLASAWLYGEGFSAEDLEAVRDLSFVEDAQLRTSVTGSAPDFGDAELDMYLETENLVNKPVTVEGADFDPSDPDGFWLCETFAQAWDIHVGDDFTASYDGILITKSVKGIVVSPEYEYMCASTDADTNYKNIGYVYMDYEGFPVREFMVHMIETGKIDAEEIEKHLDEYEDLLKTPQGLIVKTALSLGTISDQILLTFAKTVDEAQLFDLLPYTQLILTATDGVKILDKESEIAEAIDNNYAVMIDEHSVDGIERLTAELAQHEGFSYVFMAVFLAIAVLIIMTGTSRMVEQQRTQIGTLNAMGMSRGKITRHYLSYSLVTAIAGSIAGLLLGYFWVGNWIVSLFSTYYTVPGWTAGADWTFLAVPLFIIAVCVLSAWLSCRRLLKIAPSEALRPAPPKKGEHILFEKLPFWNKLGFRSRYNLRDISRYKLRALMCIFGTMTGMFLLSGTIGALDMLDGMYEWYFNKIQHFGYEAMLEADMSIKNADLLSADTNGELVMQAGIEVAAHEHAVNTEKSTQSLTVIEGKGLYNITDPSMNVIDLPEGTVAVTRRLAKKMGLSVGDTIWWHIYEENDWHESTVGAINRTPVTSGITILRSDFEKEGEDFTPTLLCTDTALTGEEADGIAAIYSVAQLRAAFEETMQIIWVLIVVMVIFAVILIVAVLYNSGSLSFHERIRELATLKVLGLSDGKIRSLLTIENIWLSLIGIVLGAPLARPLLEAMMNSNGENYDMLAVMKPSDYILGAAAVLAISVLVSFLFSGRIRKLDMVGTLKGAE